MASNFPGPWQLRIHYDCEPGSHPSVDHVLQLNIALDAVPEKGAAFTTIDVVRRTGTPVALSAVVNALVAVLQPLMSAADTALNFAELWRFADLSFEAEYYSSYDISLPGTAGAAGVPAAESIYTFRTLEGGYMRVHLIEQYHEPGISLNYSNLGSASQDLCDFIVDPSTAYFLGRDTSYPFITHKLSPGQSEALFKKRFRP